MTTQGKADFIFNGKKLGEFVMDVDGFFYYWPDEKCTGAWPSYLLKKAAKELDDLNKPWEEKITEFFERKDL